LTSRAVLTPWYGPHRSVKRRSPGRVDDAAEFEQLPGQILRHRALLRPGGTRHQRRQNGQNRFRQRHPESPVFLAVWSNMADPEADLY
jgi:hypothetical protein